MEAARNLCSYPLSTNLIPTVAQHLIPRTVCFSHAARGSTETEIAPEAGKFDSTPGSAEMRPPAFPDWCRGGLMRRAMLPHKPAHEDEREGVDGAARTPHPRRGGSGGR